MINAEVVKEQLNQLASQATRAAQTHWHTVLVVLAVFTQALVFSSSFLSVFALHLCVLEMAAHPKGVLTKLCACVSACVCVSVCLYV